MVPNRNPCLHECLPLLTVLVDILGGILYT